MKYRSKLRKNKNKSGKIPCEICGECTYLQSHHIEGRDIHKANDGHNIADICSNCHEKIHRGDIIVEGRFMTTQGNELFWHYKNEKSFTGQKKKTYLKQ